MVQVNEAHPIVTIAYLTSFERMGRARVFVDGDREGAMVIDANETSGRYSLVRVREVCFDGGASRRRPGSLPVPPCSERGSAATARRALTPSAPLDSEVVAKRLAGLAESAAFLEAPKTRSTGKSSRSHVLHVELLPPREASMVRPGSARDGNKFKVMGVSAC